MKKNNNQTYSKEHLNYLKSIKRKTFIIIALQLTILVGFLILWEVLANAGVINVLYTSSPSRMVKTIVDLQSQNNLWQHVWTTLYEAILAFVIASALAFVVAVLLWQSDLLRKVLEPYIVVLNSLPKIALGPLIIIWFGVGTKSIVVMAILIMIIVTTLSLLSSFLSCDKEKIALLQSFGANKWQILTKLVLPSSVPEFISILKINVGLTWVGTIMGEYLVSKAGLGYLIVYGGTVFKLDLVMASTLLLCILASLMYFIVALIECYYKKHHSNY